jgi:MarR family transcriptional regulator, organic hydroperoxide resistance regulator
MTDSPQILSTQSDPDMLPHQIYLNLQKILRSLNIGRSFQGKRLPITIMQMRALSLFNEQESVTITGISRSLGMSLQSATNLICRLEQLGYLERSKNEKDKRVSDVRLTAKGKKRLNAFRGNEVENVKLLLDRLNPVEIKVLNETLNGVALLFEKATSTSSR